MRYRKLDANGDYTFGHGQSDFFINEPAAVGQAVGTRLLLITKEWFLDLTEGTPYNTDILGTGTTPLRDVAVQRRILGTQGCKSITDYNSRVDPDTRAYSVQATIETIYGENVTITVPVP